MRLPPPEAEASAAMRGPTTRILSSWSGARRRAWSTAIVRVGSAKCRRRKTCNPPAGIRAAPSTLKRTPARGAGRRNTSAHGPQFDVSPTAARRLSLVWQHVFRCCASGAMTGDPRCGQGLVPSITRSHRHNHIVAVFRESDDGRVWFDMEKKGPGLHILLWDTVLDPCLLVLSQQIGPAACTRNFHSGQAAQPPHSVLFRQQ